MKAEPDTGQSVCGADGQVQHHRAHASALVTEHGRADASAIVFAWDGVGLGDDGTLHLRLADGGTRAISAGDVELVN